MKAQHLYTSLDRDFILPYCSDDWSRIAFNDYYTQPYQHSFMGLMLDNAEEIKQVYTAVFPSPAVLQRLFAMGVTDSLLFVHHPMTWDITRSPTFEPISLADLAELQRRRIAVYNLHIPLDRTTDFSTSVTLARALQGMLLESFNLEHGCEVSVIAQTPCDTVQELYAMFSKSLGHESRLYAYGQDEIVGKRVGVTGGGGNRADILEFLIARGINCYVTGITISKTQHKGALAFHETAKRHGINVLGGTHYSTEKFACIKMLDYFRTHGLAGIFLDDMPCMEDM